MELSVEVLTSEMEPIASYKPLDSTCFTLAVRLVVGEYNKPGRDTFDLEVCTPSWLVEECRITYAQVGRHRLLVDHFDPARITTFLRSYCNECAGDDWSEKIGRIARWEFEDYAKSAEESLQRKTFNSCVGVATKAAGWPDFFRN